MSAVVIVTHFPRVDAHAATAEGGVERLEVKVGVFGEFERSDDKRLVGSAVQQFLKPQLGHAAAKNLTVSLIPETRR